MPDLNGGSRLTAAEVHPSQDMEKANNNVVG